MLLSNLRQISCVGVVGLRTGPNASVKGADRIDLDALLPTTAYVL